MEDLPSLRGRLLIAAPSLLDPNFIRTVVLIAEHGDEGAMGLVLNRPSTVSVGEAVPQLEGLFGDEEEPVHVGGPVEPGALVVLAEWEEPDEAAALVFEDVGFVPAQAETPLVAGTTRRARAFAGYAGWGGGQLEAELEDGGWILGDPEPDDVFTDPGELWSRVLRRKGGRFAVLSLMPPDPSMN